MHAAEVIRYRPHDTHTVVTIQVGRAELHARLARGKDSEGKAFGFTLWISDSPALYPTEQEAITAACRYAELIVLGVVDRAVRDREAPDTGRE